MVAWLTALRFFAIKNTVAVFLVVPMSKSLTKVCRPYSQWMPICRRITTDYHKAQDFTLNKVLNMQNSRSEKKIDDQYAEDFASKMLAWTGISMGVGAGLTLGHFHHKKKKQEKVLKLAHDKKD